MPLKMVPNDSPYPKTEPEPCSEAELEFHFLKHFLTSYNPSTQFLAFRLIWGFLKWSQNIGFVTRTMSVACSEAELEFHFLKYFLTSYSPSTQFLAFRLIWGFLKWSQMIPHAQKPVVSYQNHVQKQKYTFGET